MTPHPECLTRGLVLGISNEVGLRLWRVVKRDYVYRDVLFLHFCFAKGLEHGIANNMFVFVRRNGLKSMIFIFTPI